uniref:Metalloendopeptidase n=1 Tax=Anopheles albimanus TaxID=7167 RepID=A0A182F2N2_ANOAL
MCGFKWNLAFLVLIGGLVQQTLSAPNWPAQTKPSSIVGKRLLKYAPKGSTKYKGYPHEYGFGHYYQGDIIIPPRPEGRVAVGEQYLGSKWPAGIVPYVIDANFSEYEGVLASQPSANAELQTLQDAFRQFADNTCVRFVPRLDEGHYVTITNRAEGCYSAVGRIPINDFNNINLQTPACMQSVGTPVHEMMHALGFFHEFSRPDRDNVMHYSRYAASIGICCPVLDNIKPYFGDFGTEAGLTPPDIQQINARYCNQ